MTNPFGPGTDLLERVQTITDALLPVLQAFRDELGAERANAIAARGIAEWRRRLAEAASERVVGSPRDCWEKATADTLESAHGTVEVAELSEGKEAIRFAVTGCRIAEFFRSIGEPELGFELGCAHDLAQVEAFGRGEVALERHGTLMAGAPACDFLYRFADSGPSK
jgi:hypothetical protein